MIDSFNVNFHKGLHVPVISSLLMINNHKRLLLESNNSSASYLFQGDHNPGDMTLQCGRKPDQLKVWL